MRIHKYLYHIVLIVAFSLNYEAQNLVSNPSFSEVYAKADSTQFFQISIAKSDVKYWYIPAYINFNALSKAGKYRLVRYFSSRDKNLIPVDGKQHDEVTTNGDQLFENNLGFIRININNLDPPPLVQQKFDGIVKKGDYCLKFKYKFLRYSSSYENPPSLDFIVSPTNLKEYYTNKSINVPETYVKASLIDSINDTDENTPWQQQCYKIHLNGNEQFLSFGSLRKKDPNSWGIFFVDDVELYALKSVADECKPETIEKDLRKLYTREFPLDVKIDSDTMVMYFPPFNIGSDIVSPEAKTYLNNIIAFMQRHPSVKIKFIEYD